MPSRIHRVFLNQRFWWLRLVLYLGQIYELEEEITLMKRGDRSKFINCSDIIIDKLYQIDTCGYEQLLSNNPVLELSYLPTPYLHLKQLFSKYPIKEEDHVVDFGCGKGRVVAVVAKKRCQKVTGIEINEKMYHIAVNNMEHLRNKKCKNIDLQHINALKVEIEKSMNKFHFFEPFHIKIFIKILEKILVEAKKYNKLIYIFMYNIHPTWEKYISRYTDLKCIDSLYYNKEKTYTVYTN